MPMLKGLSNQKRVALVIGIGYYLEYHPLDHCVASAREVHDMLVSPNLGRCDPQTSILKVIEQGETFTNVDFDCILSDTLDSINPGDQLVFFFCGHGRISSDDLFLVLPRSRKDRLLDSYDFKTLVRKIKIANVNKAIFIVDACHSAAMFSSVRELMNDWTPLQLPKGFGFMAAAGKFQYARQSNELKRTIFSYHLCQSIRGWKPTNSPYITLSELKNRINEQVISSHTEAEQDVHVLLHEGSDEVWLSLNPAFDAHQGLVYPQTDHNNLQDSESTVSVVSSEAREKQFERVSRWLNRLVDREFRAMIYSVLTVEQQHALDLPVSTIGRTDFLGAMQVWGYLDEIERYLHKKYPDRFAR